MTTIKVKTIEKGSHYEVNHKEVYLDSNNNWIAREELTSRERQAFIKHRTENKINNN